MKKTADGIMCLLKATQSSSAEFHRNRNSSKLCWLSAKSEMTGLIWMILVLDLGVTEVDGVLLCPQSKLTEGCIMTVSIASNAK